MLKQRDGFRPAEWKMGDESRLQARRWAEVLDQGRGHREEGPGRQEPHRSHLCSRRAAGNGTEGAQVDTQVGRPWRK